ncbi:MAG TPA: ankyrin repeat domain-containing protein [Vicinamibacterales bacterium]|nr:ankyrin repeat domain-containing protein [Vicinamibacterales bacterium]
MSAPAHRHLPERPSLEQLRKQAKEHLDALRATDPSATLAAAQYALAREYGFDSWPKLVHHVEFLVPATRPLQPAELKSDQKLLWSPGRGTDVWALIRACTTGDLEAVRALIAKDPSLARSHYEYRKPLYFAVRENRLDVVRFLLDHDSNPLDLWVDDDPLEIARDRGYAEMEALLARTLETKFNASPKGEPVALALQQHDLKRMRELLDEQPALIASGDKRSNQPIHWATMTRQLDAIDELLRRGADINAQRMDGARPIHVTNGDYFYRGWRDVPQNWPVTPAQVMKHLEARGAVIDLPTACHTGNIDRVRELLRQDPSLANRTGEHEGYYLGAGTPLSNAAAAGRMDIVLLLLEHGADPNLPEEQFAPKGKALYSAVYHGHYEIAKLLLERGAFPNPPVESSGDALWVSREWRPDKRMEQLLLSYGAAPVEERREEDWPTSAHNWLRISRLHQAARKGDVREATKLLDAGADLTARDEHLRSTPLAWAAKFGQLEMVKFLLERGAPKSLPDDPSWATPLAWATRRGHEEIVRLLRERA